MSQLTKLCTKSDLPENGEAKEFTVADKIICVANVDGVLSAMDNVCVHRGGPLGQGMVIDGKVICPWHGWQYNPKTGVPDENSSLHVAVYPIKVEGDDVLLEI